MPLFHLSFRPSRIRLIARVSTVALLLAAIALAPTVGQSEVIGSGDVTPENPTDLPINGGTAAADVIVGDTEIGILTIDIPAFTDPLQSPNGIIGNTETSRGQAVITGVSSEWRIDSVLTIGNFGYAEMSVTDGAILDSDYNSTTPTGSAGDTVIGMEYASQGSLTANGFGTSIRHTDLIVGREGFGKIDLSASAWMTTRNDATLGERQIGSNEYGGHGEVTVSGFGTRWNIVRDLLVGEEGSGLVTVGDGAVVRVQRNAQFGQEPGSYGSLTVSDRNTLFWVEEDFTFGAATGSHAIMNVDNQGVVRGDNGITLGANSRVNLDGGILRTPSTVTNSGVLRGEGRIEAAIVNNVGGDIRTAAKTANLRERLLVTGAVTNSGIIESIGGEMEFESAVTNNSSGQIFGKDAVLRFRGGLTNSGDMYVENTIVENTIVNPGLLTVGLNSSFILGDLALQSSSTLEMMLGDHNSKLVLETGDAALDGTLSLSLAPNYNPMVGDSFEIISADDVTGTFSTELLPLVSGVNFDVDYTADSVFVNVIGGTDFSADFNNDGSVNGADLGAWQTGYGTAPGATLADGDANGTGSVDGLDFLEWQRNFTGSPSVATSNAVPEPSALLLCLSGLAVIGATRSRR